MGDRKWGELPQQHHVIVRRELRDSWPGGEHGGAMIWRGSVAGRRTRRGSFPDRF
jgi:hypothetical protein